VLLVIVLVAMLAVLCIGGLVIWSRLAATNSRVIGAPKGGEPEGLFRGGILARHIITSGSLARLEFFDWGVRLRGTVISSWIVPTWEAKYEELAPVRLVALQASRVALWLRLRDGTAAIGFLSDRSRMILPSLEKRGVAVDGTLRQVRKVDDLYD
jgi:hypothetical protein